MYFVPKAWFDRSLAKKKGKRSWGFFAPVRSVRFYGVGECCWRWVPKLRHERGERSSKAFEFPLARPRREVAASAPAFMCVIATWPYSTAQNSEFLKWMGISWRLAKINENPPSKLFSFDCGISVSASHFRIGSINKTKSSAKKTENFYNERIRKMNKTKQKIRFAVLRFDGNGFRVSPSKIPKQRSLKNSIDSEKRFQSKNPKNQKHEFTLQQ